MKTLKSGILALTAFAVLTRPAYAESDSLSILRQGLLGAGTGAISAYASGGKAGKAALIGAGVGVLGNALLGLLTGSSVGPQAYPQPAAYPAAPISSVQYASPVQAPAPVVYPAQPVQVRSVYTYREEPVYVQPTQPVYMAYAYAPREDSSRRILRNGALGAGVGAVSAYASGGKAGQGALVGAGSSVIGDALLELLTR